MNKAFEAPAPTPDESACKTACKSAGRPKSCELQARTDNLVWTAGSLFLRHGYGNVSLETIAREAHVAVRTIYVKFGGKAGLLKAAIEANRDRFFTKQELETDSRPLREIVTEFALHFYQMVTAPEAVSLQRMVMAEAGVNPELTKVFFDTGPTQTREMLLRFFSRPDIRAQLREDVPIDQLPIFLINCVMGDQFSRFLFDAAVLREEFQRTLPQRLALFFRAILRDPPPL